MNFLDVEDDLMLGEVLNPSGSKTVCQTIIIIENANETNAYSKNFRLNFMMDGLMFMLNDQSGIRDKLRV